jgi:hypothetical protein
MFRGAPRARPREQGTRVQAAQVQVQLLRRKTLPAAPGSSWPLEARGIASTTVSRSRKDYSLGPGRARAQERSRAVVWGRGAKGWGEGTRWSGQFGWSKRLSGTKWALADPKVDERAAAVKRRDRPRENFATAGAGTALPESRVD